MASPHRYSPHQPEGFHHIGGRLSIHPIDRYDDTITCCLPPPSPAPTSDRFVMGIPAPSSSSISSGGSSNVGSNQHHHHLHYNDQQSQQTVNSSSGSNNGSNTNTNTNGNGSINQNGGNANVNTNTSINKYGSSTIHRTMSPSSRFRMSDRFRDLSPKCDRFVTTTHFLTNSTPLVSTDAYAYLSSTVHTPVKRYVPTPPPQTDPYPDLSQSSPAGANSGYHTIIGNSLPHQQHPQSQQHVNTLPYRFRMKCCLTDQPQVPANLSSSGQQQQQQQQQHNLHRERITVADHYATPPRVRPLKCSSNNVSTSTLSHQSNQGSGQGMLPQSSGSTSSGGSSGSQGMGRQSRGTSSVPSQCILNDYITRTPSIEYIGSAGGRVVTPVSVMSEPTNSTCLHCNTMRRTTGVHQTTQTTGPISPVPQQALTSITSNSSSSAHPELNATTDCQSTSPTPAPSNNNNNNAHTSPLSPPVQQQASSSHVHQSDQLLCSPQTNQQQHHSVSQNNTSLISSHSSLAAGRNVHNTQQQHQPQPQQLHQSNQIQQVLPPPVVAIPPQQQQQQQQPHNNLNQNKQQNHHLIALNNNSNSGSNSNLLNSTPQRNTLTIRQQMQQRLSRKQRLKEYVRREIAQFFGVDTQSEEVEKHKWCERQNRLAVRRFGPLKSEIELNGPGGRHPIAQQPPGDRPDILPAQTTAEESQISHLNSDLHICLPIQKKASVPTMIISGIFYIIQTLNKRPQRHQKQWSRSFAPSHVTALNGDNPGDICEGLTALQEEEVFFDMPGNDVGTSNSTNNGTLNGSSNIRSNCKIMEHSRQIYMGERAHGWRTSAALEQQHIQQQPSGSGAGVVCAANQVILGGVGGAQQRLGYRGIRISSQLLDGVLENSRRPIARKVKMFHSNELDDRNDHRPFFTYWINTVQILVLALSLICYGIGPIGFGVEQKTGQVLVTSLSLQTVQHQEQRNVWIGPRNNDLVHLGAKFAACMRRDVKIMDVISKTRRQERETACCIRNDDSGCVQSSQADCSVRGLWPTKSISTWKKWSPGESGPGGRISGSVCGLDPKYCDAPASIAPYEWPDDITKWPICRKTNSFSQRFRFKDHTAEHMMCEVIGHPCCTGVFGECRITTREYCDFVNGYFHEEASLCSQVSCLNNVCGMFPFLAIEVPDQFYRLFTSLCLHAGILHLAITVAFQHIFLADLERLIGPIRTAIVYIGSGLAGNLTSAILVPYKPEVGPLASLAGVISSLTVLLMFIHWRKLKKPHLALFKLILIAGTLFGMGTLPWQQNFAGLIAGIFCGVFLTIALVPFVSFTKYGRKTKINLIWTCVLFHLFIYTIMFVIFYVFPTELTSINIGDMLSGNGINVNHKNRFDIDNFGSGNNIPSNHHHHTDVIDQGGEDRVMSGGTVNEMTSISNLKMLAFNNPNLYGSSSLQKHDQSKQQQQQQQYIFQQQQQQTSQHHHHMLVKNNDNEARSVHAGNGNLKTNKKSCERGGACNSAASIKQQQQIVNNINRNIYHSSSGSGSSSGSNGGGSSISSNVEQSQDDGYDMINNNESNQQDDKNTKLMNELVIGGDMEMDPPIENDGNNHNHIMIRDDQQQSIDIDEDILIENVVGNESLNNKNHNNNNNIENSNSHKNREVHFISSNNNNNNNKNNNNPKRTAKSIENDDEQNNNNIHIGKINKNNNNNNNINIKNVFNNNRLGISNAINRHIIAA